MNRITYHLNRWIRHGDFYPDWKLRFFQRSAARWVGSNPHGRVEVDGGARRLDGEGQFWTFSMHLRDVAPEEGPRAILAGNP